MSQQIKDTLATLHRGQLVTVIYDGTLEHKQLQICGTISNIDFFWKNLQVNNVGIDFSEIKKILI